MMTFEYRHTTEAFVWVWFPGAIDPIVAGRIAVDKGQIFFNYGRSYLGRDDAIALYDSELPLRPGVQPLLDGLSMPGCLRDAAPDAWGRRVIMNRLLGANAGSVDLHEMTFLLESGSDRIGALDFQRSATSYEPRFTQSADLEQLQDAAGRVERGLPLAPDLAQALCHGSSIGGARPKALITETDHKYIAKFSTRSDLYQVVKAEFIAMRLARHCGLNVAPVLLTRAGGKDVLLIERFDRVKQPNGWARRSMVSALTLFGLDEMMARYASYEKLAEIIRHKFSDPTQTLRELFARLLFNILCGNTDDHARNHAAFWDGAQLTLTPAYDICPQARTGNEATQAMQISDGNRFSQIKSCLEAAPHFHLSHEKAREIVAGQIEQIKSHWMGVCDAADLPEVERRLLWGRQFLNPFALEGWS